MKKKILLITPLATPEERTPKGLRIPEIALCIIASFTPEEHFDVEIIEEEIEDIDFNKECDIVGISCMTANANRAYYIGSEFKKRGKTVVYGGIHPTVLPNEALQHGNAVIVGEAEGVWEEFLKDYLNGNIKQIYRSYQPDVSNYPIPKRKMSKGKGIFNVQPILTTRGCPYDCNFCSVPEFYGKKLRHLPTEKVVADIKSSGANIFLFLDDNVIGHPPYAKDLFRAMIPLKIKWVGQASISFVQNEELMKLAQASGCGALFFGLESVSTSQLKKMRKSIKEISKVEDAIKRVKDLGIHFHASLVLGFDDDTEAVFEETLEFLMRNKIGTISCNILTPYPGTQIHRQFDAEKRLLTKNWNYYDHGTVVFKPKNMTPLQLAEGHNWVRREFYKFSSIARRLSGNLSHPLLYLAMNMGGRVTTKREFLALHGKMDIIMNDSLKLYQSENKLIDTRVFDDISLVSKE
ncbi:MAG: B12-binding domain-containing radical SAM protein [Spirochaetota bacterium]|nr:B12-binding domain-containing radical SAM protein [Spirochaetota bacterium]